MFASSVAPFADVAAAKARGQRFGRRPGYRPSDKHAAEIMRLFEEESYSQQRAAEPLGISETTVNEIFKRHRQQTISSGSSGSWRKTLRGCYPYSEWTSRFESDAN